MSTNLHQEKKNTKLVRIYADMHKELKILAAQTGNSMTKLLHEMFLNMSENVNMDSDREDINSQENADLLFTGNPKAPDIF